MCFLLEALDLCMHSYFELSNVKVAQMFLAAIEKRTKTEIRRCRKRHRDVCYDPSVLKHN